MSADLLRVKTPTLEIAYEAQGAPERVPGRPAPRLPRRRARLGRRGGAARRRRPSRARAVSARLRPDALPRRRHAAHGAAGGDRAGPARLHGRAGSHRRGPRRLRLGRPRRLHREPPRPRARARARDHRRLQRAEHGGAVGARLGRDRARVLVPVVLQHRARPRRPRARTDATSASCCGASGRRAGASTTPPSSAPRSAFDNPDFVEIVIHSYRHRHQNAPGDPRFDAVERRLAARPPITVPSVVLHGGDDTVRPPRRSEAHMALFPPGTERRVVPNAGHFMPRERPARPPSPTLC